MRELDPFYLSKQFGTLAERCDRSAAPIRKGITGHDPFQGSEWPGKTLFQEIEEMDASDPLRRPLLRWTYRFLDERVQLRFRVHEGWLLHGERHGIRQPRDGQFSLAELSRLALTTREAERSAFLQTRRNSAQRLGAHRRELWARRSEVAYRLGLFDPDALGGPLSSMRPTQKFEARERPPTQSDQRLHSGSGEFQPPPEVSKSDSSAGSGLVEQLARELLDRTDAAAQQLADEGLAAFVAAQLAETASESLPARLAPDSLAGLLGDRQWLRGVSLRPFDVPARLSPSSFLLAFERLGFAWAEALAPRDFPFVVARDPSGLRSRTQGALFASWWRKEAFLRRRLGVNRAVASQQRRAFVTASLLEARKRAVGVLVRSAALSGKSRLDQEAPALSYRLFREEMAGDELLGILGIGMATPADFVALLSAWALDQSLLEEHDEDYFDNPQAIERLRDEMASVPAVHHSLQSVQPGVTLLLGDVEQAF